MKNIQLIIILLLLTTNALISAQETQKQLIVCFPSTPRISLTGEIDAVTYASGNTLSIAKIIRDMTGAEFFELELVSPYTNDYSTVLTEAKNDQKRRARPKLKKLVENIESYDTIFIGFPNWWASIPMPVASFLESHDLAGKKIIPFCTHGGGRFGQSISAIAKLALDSEILEPFEVYYGGRSTLKKDVEKWLKANGVKVK